MRKKRDELKTPSGKKGWVPTGGKAGRAPGLGNRNNSGSTPGNGVDHPAQGFAKGATKQKPPDRSSVTKKILNFKPPPKPKS